MAFTFDRKRIEYQDGDTFATAMHRAGVRTLSRSMKYHRPRGAYCFTGSCAGCLVEVDGRPNILACLEKACDAKLRSQNRMGSVKHDLLSVTDKVYRQGFDPHGAFTKPAILNRAFLVAVRFMSGVGKAPKQAQPMAPAKRFTHDVDEIIIGAGDKGVGRRTAAKGNVLLIDEGPSTAADWEHALAFGIYGKTVAVRRGGDLHEVTAKRITLATGNHDGWPLFPNNDLPGIMSLRGSQRLMAAGVAPGKRVVLHGVPDNEWQNSLEAAGGQLVSSGEVTAAKGGNKVRKARVNGKWLPCDAIVCDVPGTPRIELAQQAGCELSIQNGVLAPTVKKNATSVKGVHWL